MMDRRTGSCQAVQSPRGDPLSFLALTNTTTTTLSSFSSVAEAPDLPLHHPSTKNCVHLFIHSFTMPSVAEELAELRSRSLAKSHAEKLKDANGLRTPEQEAEALKESKSKTHVKSYTKDAVETLNAGSKAAVVDQDFDFKVQQSAHKKEDQQKQRQASQFNNAGGSKASNQDMEFKLQQTLKKKKELEKKGEAAKNLQSFKGNFDVGSAAANKRPTNESEPALADDDGAPPAVMQEETVDMVEDVPELESVEEEGMTLPEEAPTGMPMSGPRGPNRAEKKARKVMERLGMKKVPDISRVTLKMQGNQGFFTIHQPDVFEKNGSYIVFGEARQGNGMPQQRRQYQAAQQLETVEEKKADDPVTGVEGHMDEPVDESGVDAKDVDLVVSQAGCTRARAVRALKETDGDLVNAIMSLTN